MEGRKERKKEIGGRIDKRWMDGWMDGWREREGGREGGKKEGRSKEDEKEGRIAIPASSRIVENQLQREPAAFRQTPNPPSPPRDLLLEPPQDDPKGEEVSLPALDVAYQYPSIKAERFLICKGLQLPFYFNYVHKYINRLPEATRRKAKEGKWGEGGRRACKNCTCRTLLKLIPRPRKGTANGHREESNRLEQPKTQLPSKAEDPKTAEQKEKASLALTSEGASGAERPSCASPPGALGWASAYSHTNCYFMAPKWTSKSFPALGGAAHLCYKAEEPALSEDLSMVMTEHRRRTERRCRVTKGCLSL
ncbi:hypothetical protein L345_10606, partial [Ophiophagus hannah]